MEKNFIYKTVTALMLTITSVKTVLADKGDDDRVSVQYSARPLTLNKKPIISKEDQWWMDYQSSKNNIVQYVHDLSKSNPEAAAWFLLTGGKNGFSNRQATAEEEKLLLGAIQNIAPTFTKIDSKNEWMTPIRSENPIGKNHYEIILEQYQAIKLDEISNSTKNAFADQLRKMTEKAEKERQEFWAKLDREREERDRQREEDHEKRLESIDKKYVRLSRVYTPEGMQKTKQHKKAMEDFRDYYKGLIEVLNRELKHTRSDLDGLIGYEMASDLPTIQRGLKVVTDKMPWKIMTLVGLFLDSKRFNHYDEALENLRKKLYDIDLPENESRYSKQREVIEKEYNQNWLGKSKLPGWYDAYKATEDKKYKNYLEYEGTKKALYKTYFIEQERLESAKAKAPEAERPVLIEQSIEQYGSVRKANQERLKAKYAEWQTKRSTLEALGIETSSEIIETVNNAFAGLLTTADMRDGLIETLEQRAKGLEKTAARAAREKRAQEILKAQKTKELQVKARLYNKNFGRFFDNNVLNQLVERFFDHDIERSLTRELTNQV